MARGATAQSHFSDGWATSGYGTAAGAALLGFIREDQRRGPRDVELADVFEAGVAEPGGHFVEGKSVAFFGVDEHGAGEDQGAGGTGAVLVGDEFGDDDRATGGEGGEELLEELAAA